MKSYVKPTYEGEGIVTEDIMLTSIISEGEGTVGNITGTKGAVAALFDKIFGFHD